MRLVLLLNLLMLTVISASAQKQNSETLEGNGKIVTKDIPVAAFSELIAGGVYELKLVQGARENVQVTADENLHAIIELINEGNKLKIQMKNNVKLKGKNTLKLVVTFRQLEKLNLTTVGNVSSDAPLSFKTLEMKNSSVGNVNLKMNATSLQLSNSSVGNITLRGSAETATIKNKGVGNLEAAEFLVQTMDIDNTGIGNAKVNVAKGLKVKDSGIGKVTNKGEAPIRSTKVVKV